MAIDMSARRHRCANRLFAALGALAILTVVAMPAPAAAAALLAGSTFVQCSADGNNSFHATDCSQGGFVGVPPSASASAMLSPVASVSVDVASPPAAVLGAGADATAFYYFQVTGGSPGDIVPLMFDFTLGVIASAQSSALARLIVRTSQQAFHVEEVVCNPQVCDDGLLSDTFTVPAMVGANLDSVTLYALAQAPATRVSNESARAFADPYIYIDPAFPNAGLYSIVVSPGVGNVPTNVPPPPPPPPPSAVPEPSTLWLAGSLLVAVGTWRRRRTA